MASEEDKQILWLVWGAMAFSMVIYMVVPVGIGAPVDHELVEIAKGTPPKIALILGVASLALVPALVSMRRRLFFSVVGEEFERGTPEASQAYLRMSMTTWIFCEVVGVFGFAVYFLTYQWASALPFAVFGLALLLVFRPRA